MALLALTSAHGAPGTTTAALGLALSWPQPVLLVDADPSGASSIPAGWLRGGALPTDFGLVDLALSARNRTLVEDLQQRAAMRLPGSEQVRFIQGVVAPQQAGSLTALWEPLASALRSLGRDGIDVIVDCGRLGSAGSARPLMGLADLCLLVTGSSLPDIVAASAWAAPLSEQFITNGALDHLGLLLTGPGDPYPAREVADAITLPVMATLPADPRGAAILSRGAGGNLAKTKLGHALAAEAVSLSQKADALAEHRTNPRPSPRGRTR